MPSPSWITPEAEMRAIQVNQHGGPESLTPVEIDDPELGSSTDIKVRIHAAGVNPVDTKLRAGLYPVDSLPFVPGCDAAGTIIEAGADVSAFKPGDAVYFFHGGLSGTAGNYAEYHVLDERFVAAKPDSLDFIHAAAAPLVLLTAWEALFDRAQLQQGQHVYINAGAGGVGHVAIQLAKNAGAHVCTTVSNDDKARFVESLGADLVINYLEQDVEQEVYDWTGGTGVDIALDNVGGKTTEELFPLVKHYGDVVSLLLPAANLSWQVARQRNQRFSLEVMLSPQVFGLEQAQRHQTDILQRCAGLIDEDKIRIHVSDTFPLPQASEAHRRLETGHTTGKIVLLTDEASD